MNYLSPQQIIAIHDRILKRIGGSPGIRNINLLQSAAGRPQATFGGSDLYPTIFSKAAVLMYSLVKNHPFVDANKRTAITSVGIFLKLNGVQLLNKHEEEVELCVKVATDKVNLEEIAEWLKKNST